MRRVVAVFSIGLLAGWASADVIATDPAGDGFGIGVMDLLQLEANSDGIDLVLTLTINGNVSLADWGKYCFSIDTNGMAGAGGMSEFPNADPPTNDANPWVRNIAIGDPDHLAEFWLGSWLDWGSGTQLWQYLERPQQWVIVANPALAIAPGGTSTLTYTIPLATLGVGVGDTIWLEAFSTGGNSWDTAVDTVNNPSDDWNPPPGDWGAQAVVMNSTPYTIVPEPAGVVGLLLASLTLLRRR